MSSINKALKAKRIAINTPIEKIAAQLNIRKQYITAIEEENYNLIPGKVYIEGYVKLYAAFLGVEFLQHEFQQQLAAHNQTLTRNIHLDKQPSSRTVFLFALTLISLITYGWLNWLLKPLDDTDNSNSMQYIDFHNKNFSNILPLQHEINYKFDSLIIGDQAHQRKYIDAETKKLLDLSPIEPIITTENE